MKQKQLALCVGPIPPPWHGQSVAFQGAVQGLSNFKTIIVNQNATGRSLFGQLWLVFKAICKIKRTLIWHKPEVVYFTCSRSLQGSLLDIFLINSASFFKAKIINHLHGGDFLSFYQNSPKWFQKILFKTYQKVHTSIVLLPGMKKQFSELFPEMKIEVLANFYSPEFEAVTAKFSHHPPRLTYLSNIMASKGILDLLDAFAIINQKFPDVTLGLAGRPIGDYLMSETEIEKEFQARLKKLPADKVIFEGVLTGPAKVKFLQNSDIFVLPTFHHSEAFPLAIIEAMRTGNVIVSTNHNYLPEIVTPQNGQLVKIQSPVEIAQAIELFIKNPDRLHQTQQHNLEYAQKVYGYGEYTEKLEGILGIGQKSKAKGQK